MSLSRLATAIVSWLRVLLGREEAAPPVAPSPPDPEVLRRMHVFTQLSRRRVPVLPADWCAWVDEVPIEDRVAFVAGTDLSGGGRCPVCGEGDTHRPVCACRLCEAVHHVECWTYAGGCARFGCGCEHARVEGEA
jgi:hypothetical protein